jgi:leukotriene-A4 hydrolase
MPPSFPFGGMENPMLTFATPTILAGDKSLVSLIAHEMAHSWSGNLVTNATWSDFWLNEGYTVYIERRIVEELYGKRRADMEAVLGYQELLDEMQSNPPADQILHIDLAGRDPDDGATQIPYEKGALFLKQLEELFGRERFDGWLKQYFDQFAFQSITTDQSLDYMRKHLFETISKPGQPAPPKVDLSQIDVKQWVYQPGIPANARLPHSEALDAVKAAVQAWMDGKKIETKNWSAQEWVHFLRGFPRQLGSAEMHRLGTSFDLNSTANDEVLFQWLLMSVRNGYEPAYPRLEEFLETVGRRKYVKPLYEALDKKHAVAIYDKARPTYHPITQATVDALIAAKK